MERMKNIAGFISDDELHFASGGAVLCTEDEFSVFLYCVHCGCKTKMQMISLQHAICEACCKTNMMPTKL